MHGAESERFFLLTLFNAGGAQEKSNSDVVASGEGHEPVQAGLCLGQGGFVEGRRGEY